LICMPDPPYDLTLGLANCAHRATKFQVPPTFLLQQAAWLYERHLDHVRNQMKKVSGSNVPTISTSTGSPLATTGGIPMRRTGSAGSGGNFTQYYSQVITHGNVAPRTSSAFSGKSKENPALRGGEAGNHGMFTLYLPHVIS
jgi:hypothetical protein